jgi:hypothetical protein
MFRRLLKDWDKIETIIVLAILSLMVVSTYFLHEQTLQLEETEFVVDNQD